MEKAEIIIDNRTDVFIEIIVNREWDCKKPGHTTHTSKSRILLRKSEIPELVSRLNGIKS